MGYNYKENPEWGKLLAKFGAADLGIKYIYEHQVVDTFPRDSVEYYDTTPERAQQSIENCEKTRFFHRMVVR